MIKRTPFYSCHVNDGAKLVDFAGWDMPLHYGSQLEEHHIVRRAVGMFDVSHMGVVDLHGDSGEAFLQHLLANNVARLKDGTALYTCMLNEQGGIIDDLIVYKIDSTFFRLVINAGTRDKDLAWIKQHAVGYDLQITERTDVAMLAVQGPQVKHILQAWLSEIDSAAVAALRPFTFLEIDNFFIAKTGYTGEEGYEIMLPNEAATALWQTLQAAGVLPCGLGSRDTLRLEAGLNLYGLDMDETISPLEANLSWTVAFNPKERHFIGRTALEVQKQAGIKHKLVGIVLQGAGIMRHDQKVVFDNLQGKITSGGYSPTLGVSIALARVPLDARDTCFVEIRKKLIPAKVIKLPFVRHGKKMF